MNPYSSKIKDWCIFKGTFCETVLKSGYIWFLFPVVFSNTVLEHIIVFNLQRASIYIISFYWICLPEVGLVYW